MLEVDREQRLVLPVSNALLEGELSICREARGLVLFAHGSGSSRKSPRNRYVAKVLQGRGLGTLLFDLLTAEEERLDAIDSHLRFDIDLLSRRLGDVTDLMINARPTSQLAIGYFGASTGAAAALIAAAQRPLEVNAVVSRGGRPDLAGDALAEVRAPTLLIVGGRDADVLDLNRAALECLPCEKSLAVVPGATHLFAESRALEQAARLAADWFELYLTPELEGGARPTRPYRGSS